eukprot:TRINITY_DN1815_c0_g1_i1.p1 TRINITY_DN1815_c0_g1~~TRINITY_DN1815_c0_g1_i1.p1  ORF type:complete len:280 (-),score=104.04 TRINITY_DN1815_c0_g1_i1:91-930(-)
MGLGEFLVTSNVLVVGGMAGAVVLGKATPEQALKAGVTLGILDLAYTVFRFPWDIYFGARRARIQALESKERGLSRETLDRDIAELKSIERKGLLSVVLAHLGSAGAVYLLSKNTSVINKHIAWLFVGSMFLRPAYEIHDYVKKRLQELIERVHYPREDVLTLKQNVNQASARTEQLTDDVSNLRQQLSELRSQLNTAQVQIQSQNQELATKYKKFADCVSRLAEKFEQSIAVVNTDQKMLAGVKAFVAMIRQASQMEVQSLSSADVAAIFPEESKSDA